LALRLPPPHRPIRTKGLALLRWVCQCPGIFRPGTLKELIVAGPGTGFG
jgi:hypothetical protein